MDIKERFNLEFKEKINKKFLKTVSAYANYNDEEIIFGIDDAGNVVGLDNIDNECIKIENMINDSLDPVPQFTTTSENKEGKNIVVLRVKKGGDTPYYSGGKTYKRSDTSTVEVDRSELTRLALNGVNMDYEKRKASSQNLSFNVLKQALNERAGIKRTDLDILRTLNLYDVSGYFNIAGELLADKNQINFSGIDIIRFGADVDQILYRETINNKSLLSQYYRALAIFEQYYQYEEIEGYERVKKEMIPREAFREALANAIIHRVWDINSYIQISMYDDLIEIKSPGGLPNGLSKKEYLHYNISVLRNPIISGVFYRLGIIEKFGTGIARINREYINSLSKPDFHIEENSISILLPVIRTDTSDLAKDEIKIYNLLKKEKELSRKELDDALGFDKAKTIRILNNLVKKKIIIKQKQGPGTTYKLI
ncbi:MULTISPECIES: ATP-binding protein [Synergistaceae]|uniref:ATP-binding protein n=1 Tax=Synergistaceae TaxID=649777 RepID=UPI003AEAB7E0|nr:putative DNA binding domain-containing protein [Synergistaceae bacterium DZ-S4]